MVLECKIKFDKKYFVDWWFTMGFTGKQEALDRAGVKDYDYEENGKIIKLSYAEYVDEWHDLPLPVQKKLKPVIKTFRDGKFPD